jgi:hypothetical protein
MLDMNEKVENSFHGVFAITPSIHDYKIAEPAGLTRQQKIRLLGVGAVEVGSAVVNTRSIIILGLTGVEMVASGIGGGIPTEIAGGVAVIGACSLITRLPMRAIEKSGIAVEKVLYHSCVEKTVNKTN